MITVTNLGTSKVRDLVITQSVPAGATFVSADDRGVHRAGTVTWKLTLKATKKVILHASMTVATTPAELLRLATVACAQISTTGAPLVCASDSDQLPAGAVAESAQQAAEQPGVRSTNRVWWYGGGAAGLVGGRQPYCSLPGPARPSIADIGVLSRARSCPAEPRNWP